MSSSSARSRFTGVVADCARFDWQTSIDAAENQGRYIETGGGVLFEHGSPYDGVDQFPFPCSGAGGEFADSPVSGRFDLPDHKRRTLVGSATATTRFCDQFAFTAEQITAHPGLVSRRTREDEKAKDERVYFVVDYRVAHPQPELWIDGQQRIPSLFEPATAFDASLRCPAAVQARALFGAAVHADGVVSHPISYSATVRRHDIPR